MKKDKISAIVLAIFFGVFTWCYTYKKDSNKFWLCLILSILLCWTFIVPIGLYIYSIIDVIIKDNDWYNKYK